MDFEKAGKLYKRGRELCDAGNYKAAVQILKQAAQETQRKTDDSVSTAKRKELEDIVLEIWDWCAMAMHRAGDYRDAIACNNRNLATRLHSSDYGPGNEDTLENRRRLVENHSALGQYNNAIAECRSILKLVDGSNDRNTLAQSLFRKGDEKSMKEAVNINLYTLKRDEAKLGKRNLSLCEARHNLGVELYKLKKF
jgi:tetratricopeptide (TPR) repeat protein